METIFDHNITIRELKEYEASYLDCKDYISAIKDTKIAYGDIASLYANRGYFEQSEKYKMLSGFYYNMPSGIVCDECLPYKLS
ncbi:MAG: hypothetical protein RRX93_06825 [Bacteroidales bacterium]